MGAPCSTVCLPETPSGVTHLTCAPCTRTRSDCAAWLGAGPLPQVSQGLCCLSLQLREVQQVLLVQPCPVLGLFFTDPRIRAAFPPLPSELCRAGSRESNSNRIGLRLTAVRGRVFLNFAAVALSSGCPCIFSWGI